MITLGAIFCLIVITCVGYVLITVPYDAATKTQEFRAYPLAWTSNGEVLAIHKDTIWFNLDNNGTVSGLPASDYYSSIETFVDERFREEPSAIVTWEECGKKPHFWSHCSEKSPGYIFKIAPGTTLVLDKIS